MLDKTIEERIEGAIKDETAQSKAVSTLIEVKDKKEGQLGSDIELKTDFENDKIVCIHTGVDIMAFILSLKKKDFVKTPILNIVTTIKERKLLSKGRKSREEIVEIARSPDMQMISDGGMGGGGFVKKFMTSRKEKNIHNH